MRHYTLRPKAVEDLDSIWEYSLIAWGGDQALRYIRLITKKGFELLVEDPEWGRSCDDLRKGYRKYRVGQHVIFYRITESGNIDIVRVLHGMMDFERHL